MCSSSSTTTSRRSRVRASLALLIAASAGCRLPAPEEPSERTLFRDLERQITVTSTTGWISDRLEIENIVKTTLDSVCRVAPEKRRELAAWLADEIKYRGGPVEQAWKDRGKDLDAVEDLVVLTRIDKLLARAEELAKNGDCPFWLEPEEPFRGRQISERRWQLVFGGGGKGIAVRQGDRADLSAGGAARGLFGRAFTDGHALYGGIELGASAAFPKNASGERTSLVLGTDIVFPLVYRRTLTNAYVELEGGYLARANETDWSKFDRGFHVGVALGGRALRTRFLFPGAAFGISYERTFDDDVTLIKVGGRVTFDLDL